MKVISIYTKDYISQENFLHNYNTIKNFFDKSFYIQINQNQYYNKFLDSLQYKYINNLENCIIQLDNFWNDFMHKNSTTDVNNININLKDIFNKRLNIWEEDFKNKIECGKCNNEKYFKINILNKYNISSKIIYCDICQGRGYISNSNEKLCKEYFCEYFNKENLKYQLQINDIIYTFNYNFEYKDELDNSSKFQYYKNKLIYTKVIKLEDLLNNKCFTIKHLDDKIYLLKTKTEKIIDPNKIYKLKNFGFNKNPLYLKIIVQYPEDKEHLNINSQRIYDLESRCDEIIYLDTVESINNL